MVKFSFYFSFSFLVEVIDHMEIRFKMMIVSCESSILPLLVCPGRYTERLFFAALSLHIKRVLKVKFKEEEPF